jgi:hypothetical protein
MSACGNYAELGEISQSNPLEQKANKGQRITVPKNCYVAGRAVYFSRTPAGHWGAGSVMCTPDADLLGPVGCAEPTKLTALGVGLGAGADSGLACNRDG